MEVSDTYPQTHTLVPLSCLFSQAAAEEIRGCQRKRAAAKEETRIHHRRRKTNTHSSGGVFLLIKYGKNTAVLNCAVSHLREFPFDFSGHGRKKLTRPPPVSNTRTTAP